MFENTKAFCSFSVKDISKTRKFYSEILGLKVTEENMGDMTLLTLHLSGGGEVLIYPKEDHVPATFTILNFPVVNLEKAIKALAEHGITFERSKDDQGPLSAWFKDPSGNFLSIIEDKTVENKIEINKFIPVEREKVFTAWTQGQLMEQWFYPEGMSLVVEKLEPRILGHFIFRHTGEEGIFFTTGVFKEFIPNQKLSCTYKMKGPDGEVILDTVLTLLFEEKYGGTSINLSQEGFADKNTLKNCEKGWINSLENLFKLLVKGLVSRPEDPSSLHH